MNPRPHTFPSPVKIFQVFRHVNVYGKDEKSFDARREKMEWKPMPSKSGYVKDGELYLPESIQDNPDFKTCDLITIIDNAGPGQMPPYKGNREQPWARPPAPVYNHCFHLTRVNKLDIFKIHKQGEIELHLEYGDYGCLELGVPRRDNIKLCDIKLNQPVEIKINGKIDSSLSSGRARMFKEQDYIIEYIGDFDKCYLLREPWEPVLKKVPQERKLVDMMKTLW